MTPTDSPRPRYWSILTPLPAPILVEMARQAEAQGLRRVPARRRVRERRQRADAEAADLLDEVREPLRIGGEPLARHQQQVELQPLDGRHDHLDLRVEGKEDIPKWIQQALCG